MLLRPLGLLLPGKQEVSLRLARLCAATAWLIACGSSPVVVVDSAIIDEERPFYLRPMSGFFGAVPSDAAREIGSAHLQLLTKSDSSGAAQVASSWLVRDPRLGPAMVLQAQAQMLEGDFRSALASVAPLESSFGSYEAAAMVYARASEGVEDVVAAFGAYSHFEDLNAAAGARAIELRPHALEVQGQLIRDSLARGHIDLAKEQLSTLEEWEPEQEETLVLAFELAKRGEDVERQRFLGRRLVEIAPEDSERLAQLGVLEMEVGGDPNRALEIFKGLNEIYPEEGFYQDQYERAKFFWRLKNLPAIVSETVAVPELTRADFAVLVYWLVPGVRAGANVQAKIATDILDHSNRQEIMRVVNIELMQLDRSTRSFGPHRAITRVEGLRSLLKSLHSGHQLAACVAETSGSFRSWDSVCEFGTRCSVLPSIADCLPSAPLSGQEALEWIRRVAAQK